MADTTLMTFVEESLRKGVSRDDIDNILLKAGWPKDQVSAATSAYFPADFPVPVPRPKSQVSARDAFMYLVMFSMMYTSAFNFGSLLFQFIDQAFPDPLIVHYSIFASNQMIWSISTLMVAFPTFLFVSSRISKGFAKEPSQRNSAVRKWLTYLTLAIATCVIVGDLISLLYSLLSGELTVRFFLKSLTVGLIAGSIFGYYLWSMHSLDKVTN